MWLRSAEGGSVLAVWIQPRAARDEVVGVQGDALKIRLCAPPVDGQANDALVRLLAKRLDLPRAAVTLATGHTGRRKTLRLDGLAPHEVARRLDLEER